MKKILEEMSMKKILEEMSINQRINLQNLRKVLIAGTLLEEYSEIFVLRLSQCTQESDVKQQKRDIGNEKILVNHFITITCWRPSFHRSYKEKKQAVNICIQK